MQATPETDETAAAPASDGICLTAGTWHRDTDAADVVWQLCVDHRLANSEALQKQSQNQWVETHLLLRAVLRTIEADRGAEIGLLDRSGRLPKVIMCLNYRAMQRTVVCTEDWDLLRAVVCAGGQSDVVRGFDRFTSTVASQSVGRGRTAPTPAQDSCMHVVLCLTEYSTSGTGCADWVASTMCFRGSSAMEDGHWSISSSDPRPHAGSSAVNQSIGHPADPQLVSSFRRGFRVAHLRLADVNANAAWARLRAATEVPAVTPGDVGACVGCTRLVRSLEFRDKELLSMHEQLKSKPDETVSCKGAHSDGLEQKVKSLTETVDGLRSMNASLVSRLKRAERELADARASALTEVEALQCRLAKHQAAESALRTQRDRHKTAGDAAAAAACAANARAQAAVQQLDACRHELEASVAQGRSSALLVSRVRSQNTELEHALERLQLAAAPARPRVCVRNAGTCTQLDTAVSSPVLLTLSAAAARWRVVKAWAARTRATRMSAARAAARAPPLACRDAPSVAAALLRIAGLLQDPFHGLGPAAECLQECAGAVGTLDSQPARAPRVHPWQPQQPPGQQPPVQCGGYGGGYGGAAAAEQRLRTNVDFGLRLFHSIAHDATHHSGMLDQFAADVAFAISRIAPCATVPHKLGPLILPTFAPSFMPPPYACVPHDQLRHDSCIYPTMYGHTYPAIHSLHN